MLKFLTGVLDYLWKWEPLRGVRHKIARWVGLGLATYAVLATEGPFAESLPDLSPTLLAVYTGWLATKGIAFAKAHKPT